MTKVILESDAFKAFAINEFGDGQHPMADETTLSGFNSSYVRLCVKRAIKSGKLSDAAVRLGFSLLIDVNAEERASKWLADGNEAEEKGNQRKAGKCFQKAQYWLDRANRARDWS